MDTPWTTAAFRPDDGAVPRWTPIPSYAELKARCQILKSESRAAEMLQQQYLRDIARFNWVQDQSDEGRRTRRAEQAQHREKEAIDTVIHSIHNDMWDHADMRKGRMPASGKRRAFCLQMCETFTVDFNAVEWNRRKRAWIRAHLPPDVVEEVRAAARERWRKAAYLLGIVSFWARVACAPGSRGARAAVARVEKRARTM